MQAKVEPAVAKNYRFAIFPLKVFPAPEILKDTQKSSSE
jgi:hypothetical protein